MRDPMRDPGDDREPVSAPMRRLGASLLTLGRIRLELLAIEAQEEKERIASLLLWAVLAALLAGFGVLTALVLLVLWSGQPLLALAVATVVLAALAGVAVFKVRALVRLPGTLFQSSIAELREDAAALRRERADDGEPAP